MISVKKTDEIRGGDKPFKDALDALLKVEQPEKKKPKKKESENKG